MLRQRLDRALAAHVRGVLSDEHTHVVDVDAWVAAGEPGAGAAALLSAPAAASLMGRVKMEQ